MRLQAPIVRVCRACEMGRRPSPQCQTVIPPNEEAARTARCGTTGRRRLKPSPQRASLSFEGQEYEEEKCQAGFPTNCCAGDGSRIPYPRNSSKTRSPLTNTRRTNRRLRKISASTSTSATQIKPAKGKSAETSDPLGSLQDSISIENTFTPISPLRAKWDINNEIGRTGNTPSDLRKHWSQQSDSN